MLTKHPSALATGTDVSDRAVRALGRSRVREVVLLGRRGVLQAAFTIKVGGLVWGWGGDGR
jgi:hypothetical protein